MSRALTGPLSFGLSKAIASPEGVGGISTLGAALAMWFDTNQAYKSSGGGVVTPDSILTYTAPSPKLVYGSDGVLRYAPHNLLLRSEEFDNAYWTKNAGGISANAVAAPDGTTTADKLIGVASATQQWVYRTTSITVGNGVAHTVSCYMKADGYNFCQLRILTGGTNANVGFNLSAGTIYSTASGSGTITDVGGGWYRCTATGVSDGTSAQIYINVSDTASLSKSFTGDGTSGIYIWGAQLNLGPTALTYIPTTTAAVYSLPIDYDPVTHEALGVLIEEQRTNYITRSDDMSHVDWQKLSTTATAGLLTEDTTATSHGIRELKTFPDGGFSFSVFVKPNGRSKVFLQVETGGAFGNRVESYFDLITGVASATAFGTFSGVSTTVGGIDADGYRRIAVNGNTGTKGGTGEVFVFLSLVQSGTTLSYTGDGVSGVYARGWQLEAGAFPTSYIPTVASQVTRARDNISLSTSSFSWSDAAGTLLGVWRCPQTTTTFRVVDGQNSAGRFNHFVTSTQAVLDKAGTGTISAAALTRSASNFATSGYAYDASGGVVVANGTLGSVGANTGIAQTVVNIGDNAAGTTAINGHIKRLDYYAVRKTNAELQVLST